MSKGSVGAILVLVVLSVLRIKSYSENVERREKPQIAKLHKWAENRVFASPSGDYEFLLASTREYLRIDQIASLDKLGCSASDLWNGKPNNPNWISRLDGVTAFKVTCKTTARGNSKELPNYLEFRWIVNSETGAVTSFEVDEDDDYYAE